jgi:endoglucanase
LENAIQFVERHQLAWFDRRRFLKLATGFAAASSVGVLASDPVEVRPRPSDHVLPEATAGRLPRWRGFNLLEKFTKRRDGNGPFRESDFEWIAELGFNFVRLPMSYLCWTDPSDWLQLREAELKHIDDAVDLGRKHGVHVNINFHRAPGYCVNPPREPLDLWTDEKALEACAFHWGHFAKRYKGLPNSHVSFDLLNEPGVLSEDKYVRVVRRLVEAFEPKTRIAWSLLTVYGGATSRS